MTVDVIGTILLALLCWRLWTTRDWTTAAVALLLGAVLVIAGGTAGSLIHTVIGALQSLGGVAQAFIGSHGKK